MKDNFYKYVCIDIGGTAIKYGLANEHGIFKEKNLISSEAKKCGGKGIVAKIEEIVNLYIKLYNIEGVAISTAGIVDCQKGKIIYAFPEVFPDYSGMCLKELVESKFGVPCCVENDVNSAALGEMWLGAGKGKKSLFCITVGTGIGGCAVHEGRIIHGVSNSAGEIAYMKIPGGSMHELATTTHLIEYVSEKKGIAKTELNGKVIFEWAKSGDTVAINAIANLTEHLADGIVNIVAVLNPQMVILGGGIMAQKDYLRPLVDAALQRRLTKDIYDKMEVDFAKLGNDAGMIGALYNLLNQRVTRE